MSRPSDHPQTPDGKMLHTYCLAGVVKDEDHTRHPKNIGPRLPYQCLWCEAFAPEAFDSGPKGTQR